MQLTLPDGLLDAWFMVAEKCLRCGDRFLLGAWLRVWIGNGKLIHAMACVCRAFKPFLFPVCPLCRFKWTYDGSSSHAHFMPMCRERVVQANTCFCVTEQLHVFQTELAYDKGHSGEENVCIAGVTCARILKADSLKAILSSPRHVPRGLKMKSVRELCSVFRNRVPGNNGQSSVTSSAVVCVIVMSVSITQ